MSAPAFALCVDVGGSKILAARIDTSGRLLAHAERPTPARRGAAAVLAAMDEALAALPDAGGAVGLGICAAGVIDAGNATVLDATDALPGWAGTDLRAHFAQRLGLQVFAQGDVHAALAGELAWGALARAAKDAPYASAVMLTLGTGLGGALAVNGQVQRGHHGLAGHFGRGLLQQAGRWRTVESIVSGSGLANLYRELGGELPSQAGVNAGARAVLALGDTPLARQALALWIEHLAAQLHNLHWSLDPAVVVLGGGMLDAQARWWPSLMQALGALPLVVVPAALGNRAGVFGAARQVFEAIELPQ